MILTENQHTPTMRLVASVNCLQKINIFIVADIIMTSVNFSATWISFVDATILLVSTVMGNCLYLILKVVLVYFFSRCLQTVLPHIHLLWELALTNEVLIVQM